MFLHVPQEASSNFFASYVFFMHALADSQPGCRILFKNITLIVVFFLSCIQREALFCNLRF